MAQFSVKYKFSTVVLVLLVVLVVAVSVLFNFMYLKSEVVPIKAMVKPQVGEAEMTALVEIKARIIDNVVYKQLVPWTSEELNRVAPTALANPFQNKDQKE